MEELQLRKIAEQMFERQSLGKRLSSRDSFLDGFIAGFHFTGHNIIWHDIKNDKPVNNQLVLATNYYSEKMMSVYYDAVHDKLMLCDTSFPKMPNLEMNFTHWTEMPPAPQKDF